MRVLLDASIFDSAANVDLPVFFWLGAVGRHRVSPRDVTDERYLRWLASQSQESAEDWALLFDICDQAHALEPSALTVVVAWVRESAWAVSPPTLSPGDALTLLTAPYWILVENSTSDRAFFLAILEREQREFVERLENDERLQFEHGGGSDMLSRIGVSRRRPPRALRTSVLFDSDALRPGVPSGESEAKSRACEGLHHHQLEARSIENYLPLDALSRWAAGRSSREALLSAFRLLSPDQRYHYNMKAGFAGDRPRAAEAGRLYDNVPARVRDALAEGFGKDIATLFARTQLVSPSDFDPSIPALQRVRTFAREVIARLR